MYEKGQGLQQDYIEAHKWFNLAARIGFANAVMRRNGVAKLMTKAQVAEAQKLAREWRPIVPSLP